MNANLKLKTYLRLGLGNLGKVALYRLGLRLGFHPVTKLKNKIHGTRFFNPATTVHSAWIPPSAWKNSALYFGHHHIDLNDGLPSWLHNPFTNQDAGSTTLPWWKISDFDLPTGDIKTIWEPSRLDWVLNMAQRAVVGNETEIHRLNSWLANWCELNPTYEGPNWKCGQEASIRVMHLALASQLLGQVSQPNEDLTTLVEAHLARIHPTLDYAMAQDNNHGTSEAAALFIGGSMCEASGLSQGKIWAADGRKWLENRVRRLVATDGSFSQHSLNYHRLMLDTLSLAELWRSWLDLPPFSTEFTDRACAAAEWLRHMVDPTTGEGPNIGDNDGACLLPLTDADYRDFRPSVQLAMALFANQLAFSEDGPHDTHLQWLQVERPEITAPALQSRNFPDGGYSLLRTGMWKGFLKFPKYQFRPRHCDALHLDLWHGPQNILRDAGSFSYNTVAPWQDYFPGTRAHNTIEFDDRDQMPSVGRFLRGAWLEATDTEFVAENGTRASAAAGYTDWQGARHHREIKILDDGVTVHDRISKFSSHAILRWRLQPGSWAVTGSEVVGSGFKLSINADVDIARVELVEGWESRYYLEKTELPVLEVELRTPGTIITEIKQHKTT